MEKLKSKYIRLSKYTSITFTINEEVPLYFNGLNHFQIPNWWKIEDGISERISCITISSHYMRSFLILSQYISSINISLLPKYIRSDVQSFPLVLPRIVSIASIQPLGLQWVSLWLRSHLSWKENRPPAYTNDDQHR